VTSLESAVDTENLTLTFVAEFDAPVERVWQVWEDPRQLERWWGPPTWPATFVTFEPVPGGRANYYMTGPEGDTSGGWWTFTSVTPPRALEFDDGFANPDGTPNESTPTTRIAVTLDDISEAGAAKTRMTTVSTFASLDALEKMLGFGMREGMSEAMGQIEALLLA
jgi:uncharacterized protein YndB with AHSA1/START domain